MFQQLTLVISPISDYMVIQNYERRGYSGRKEEASISQVVHMHNKQFNLIPSPTAAMALSNFIQ
mgnify:CR=1 FL=1